MNSENNLAPGQLVRLRLNWDDIDDDIEMPEDEVRAPSPIYYAQKVPTDRLRFEAGAVEPGQIGMFLKREAIQGVDRKAHWDIVLIGEQKYRFPARMMEAYEE